jgi:isopentenyl phosphate kinase
MGQGRYIVERREEAQCDSERRVCTHVSYKPGAIIAIHGAGSTAIAASASQGPHRGDLVSFVKAKSGNGVRDLTA